MTDCVWIAADQPRMLRNRHDDDCESDDCRGCRPCTDAHCGMDGRTHLDVSHPLHCPECVGSVRDDLTEIGDLCTHLRERAYTGADAQGRRFASMRLPGGDPAALHGPVSDGSADQRLRWVPVFDPEHPDADENGFRAASEHDNGHHGSLELPGDPEPPALTLGTWEDAWRKWLGHDSGPRFDYAKSVAYLMRHLTMMAQVLDKTTAVGLEFAPDFGEFARDIRRLRRHLEDKLADGDRAEVTRVPCLECGARLVKVYGRWESDDHHVCPRCRRRHDDGEFARAKHQAMLSDGAEAWIPLTDAARSIGRSVHTVRTWVNTGKVQAEREVIEGDGGVMTRVDVWWPDVRHADIASSRRNRSA